MRPNVSRSRVVAALLAAHLALAASARAAAPTPPRIGARAAAARARVGLDRATRRDVRRMSDRALHGREPGRPEYHEIAGYAARVLGRARFRPLGEGDRGAARYFHPFTWTRGEAGRAGASVNVVGVRPGTDARDRRATLVIAHLDHIEGFGGAVDNASGSSTALRVARALRDLPLRKNVIVMLSSAEEKGLLGTEAFMRDRVAERAGYQIDEVLNFDMIGGDTDRLYVFGGTDGASTRKNPLYRTVMKAGRAGGFRVLAGYRHDGEEDSFRRSDQWATARRGIPSVFVSGDYDVPYHSPEDTPDKLNYPKIGRAADLALRTLRALDAAQPARAPAPRERARP